jgi:heme-degrading monooxygenase HmoA
VVTVAAHQLIEEEQERMYVSMSRLRLPEAQVPELVEAFANRARLVDSCEGFLDLEVWRSDRDPGEVIMVSRWSTREAFTAYMKSEEHKTSHARITPALKSVIQLERLDHLHTYEVMAR